MQVSFSNCSDEQKVLVQKFLVLNGTPDEGPPWPVDLTGQWEDADLLANLRILAEAGVRGTVSNRSLCWSLFDFLNEDVDAISVEVGLRVMYAKHKMFLAAEEGPPTKPGIYLVFTTDDPCAGPTVETVYYEGQYARKTWWKHTSL